MASFRVGVYALWPFGRTIVDKRTAGVGSLLGNVISLMPLGKEIVPVGATRQAPLIG